VVAGQVVMADTVIPGSYWVRVTGHRVFATGTLFLAVQEWCDDWLLCWRDGERPQPEKRLGTLLRRGQVERK
jgi:hypothetical protein